MLLRRAAAPRALQNPISLRLTRPLSSSTRERRNVTGIIFDWAGTLVDWGFASIFCTNKPGSCAPVIALRRVLAAVDINVSDAVLRRGMGKTKRDHWNSLMTEPEVAEQIRALPLSAQTRLKDTSYDIFERQLLPEAALERCQPLPGVVEALTLLQQRGIRCGSCSGYPKFLLREVARRSGFWDERGNGLVQSIVGSDEVAAGRPAPWMALLAAERIGQYPMSCLVKVDDTIAGIEEGLKAGMISVGVVETGSELGLSEIEFRSLSTENRSHLNERIQDTSSRLKRAGADAVLRSVADLPRWLDEFEKKYTS